MKMWTFSVQSAPGPQQQGTAGCSVNFFLTKIAMHSHSYTHVPMIKRAECKEGTVLELVYSFSHSATTTRSWRSSQSDKGPDWTDKYKAL